MNRGRQKTKRQPLPFTPVPQDIEAQLAEYAWKEIHAWLKRPRLHIAIFAEAWRDSELEAHFAKNNVRLQEPDTFQLQKSKRKREIQALIKDLEWPEERLHLFMQRVSAYRNDPSIRTYLEIRRDFPEVEIQVSQFGGIEALFALEKIFLNQGIDPELVAAALDAVEPGIDALCLRLLELLVEREALPKSGPGHIQRRRNAISDATVNYLIAVMMEAYDWNEHTSRIPASLVVLIRHQICGARPDLDQEARGREYRDNLAMSVAQQLKPGEQLSINKLKNMTSIPRTTAARLLANPDFRRSLEVYRRWASEGLFEDGKRAALERLRESAPRRIITLDVCCPSKKRLRDTRKRS